jgi:Terminase small subunit
MSAPSSPVPTDAPKKPKTLNRRQRAFIEAYMTNGFNALGAAKKAGYSKKDIKAGDRLMKIPHVHDAIIKRLTHHDLDIQADGAAIRRGFERIAYDPRTPGKGGPTKMERMTALRNLGQMRGVFINKHLVSDVSLEQLLTSVDELEEQAGPSPTPARLLPP